MSRGFSSQAEWKLILCISSGIIGYRGPWAISSLSKLTKYQPTWLSKYSLKYVSCPPSLSVRYLGKQKTNKAMHDRTVRRRRGGDICVILLAFYENASWTTLDRWEVGAHWGGTFCCEPCSRSARRNIYGKRARASNTGNGTERTGRFQSDGGGRGRGRHIYCGAGRGRSRQSSLCYSRAVNIIGQMPVHSYYY